MSHIFNILYTIISVAVAVISIIVGVKSIKRSKRDDKKGLYLGLACFSAAYVVVTYYLSLIGSMYFVSSLFSSLYFIGFDFLLFFVTLFMFRFTGYYRIKANRKFLIPVLLIWGLVDVITLLINPFREVAVGYVDPIVMGYFTVYSYQMHGHFIAHLIYTYLLSAGILFGLILKTLNSPSGYKRQYWYIVLFISAVIFINATFLFFPKNFFTIIDYSIWTYAIVAIFIYWSCYDYTSHGMLRRLRNDIFETLDQGVVLFDYEDNVILYNDKAIKLLAAVDFTDRLKVSNFAVQCGIDGRVELKNEKISFQTYIASKPVRCDYNPLTDSRGNIMGKVFVFSDLTNETDILTGFRLWEDFKHSPQKQFFDLRYPVGVAIYDINGLTTINNIQGREAGDKALSTLASVIREAYPKGAILLRGKEADLIVLMLNSTEETMQSYYPQIKQSYTTWEVLAGFATTSEEAPDVTEAINKAKGSLSTKKLLDKNSKHSELLTSLICALQECDPDTEAHVRRTQLAGEKLGKCIGLTDAELSDLSLLCILHDIGKIGIPLEILNKPAKLTGAEWKIIRSHVEKGQQIASSSAELQHISELIYHHHERWDGKGYPDGLSKETIPVLCRIISIVDAYDAMTHDRAYRPSIGKVAAMEELRKCAGTQFDPSITAEYLRILETDGEVLPKTKTKTDELIESAITHQSIGHSDYISPLVYARYILDENDKIIQIDENFEKITGYTQKEVDQGLYQSDLIPDEDKFDYVRILSEKMAQSDLVYIEHRIRKKDGTTLFVYCSGKQYFDSATRSERSEIVITDSSETFAIKAIAKEEHKKAQKRLERWEKQFRSDSLTGLLTHEAFKNDVETKLLLDNQIPVMLMLDADRFKEYNDTYGHSEGDKALISIAQTLQKVFPDELVCRMGGDEYAVVLFYDPSKRDSIESEIKTYYEQIAVGLTALQTKLGFSMGCAIGGKSFDELYTHSDKALYDSKDRGKGCLSFYKQG